MVEQHVCTFCGVQLEPGTGKMLVKKDGKWLLVQTHMSVPEPPKAL